jgi:REP element-mobilizing transposase RayT
MGYHAAKRIPGFSYRGICDYLVTICEAAWLPTLIIPEVADVIASQFLHRTEEHRMELSAYCIMPDHFHLVCRGLSATSDLRAYVGAAKGGATRWFTREYGGRIWRQGFDDRLLRTERAFANAMAYVVANPVKAGFVTRPEAWPFLGSSRYSREELIALHAGSRRLRSHAPQPARCGVDFPRGAG